MYKRQAHYDLRFLKPLADSMLHEIGKRFKQVVTIEDGVLKGVMGSAILEFMADNEYNPQGKRVGLPDLFVQHGSVKELYHICGMDHNQCLIVIVFLCGSNGCGPFLIICFQHFITGNITEIIIRPYTCLLYTSRCV